jgi:transposase-like protein
MLEEDTIECKYCNSNNVIKYGTQSDTQLYYCKDCQRKFKDDDSLFGGRVSANDVSSALLEYYSGLSVNDIRRRILQEKGYEPAQSTVYQWIDKYTQAAVDYYSQFKPNVGDTWIADETVLHLDGGIDVWLWDVIDEDTRFLLASKMSYRRTIEDAKILFELAYRRAGKEPKVIVTDKLNLYPEAVSQVFGGKSEHSRSSPFVEKDGSTRRIERWHETLKERTKVLYGLRNPNSALAFLDGFFAYYNFIRPHEGLDHRTPAEAAGIKYNVKTWADVARIGSMPKDNGFEPEYAISPVLLEARTQMVGAPYKTGRQYGSKKGVNKADILAAQKRLKRQREKTKRDNVKAKKQAVIEAKAKLEQPLMAVTFGKRRIK